jgi:hypothetical protein
MADTQHGPPGVPSGLILGLVLVMGCAGSEDHTRPQLDSLPPSAPGDLVAQGYDQAGGVRLDWSTSEVDPDLAGYIVYRSSSEERGFQPLNAQPVATNTYVDARALPGETYWYAVSARDIHQNESKRSAAARVSTGTDPPLHRRP